MFGHRNGVGPFVHQVGIRVPVSHARIVQPGEALVPGDTPLGAG